MQRTKKVPAPDDWLAAEIGKQGPQEKLERYETARLSNENVHTFLEESNSPLKRYVKRMADCGSWIVFRHYHQINETRVIKANFCKKHLLCQLCALRRSALQVQTYEKKLATVFDENPEMIPVLVTLTVKNGESLEERFQHIDRSLTKLIKKRKNAIDNDRNNTVLRHVLGGAGSYEFKRGSGSTAWHPHVHQIWLLPKGEFSFSLRQRKKKMVWVPIEFENALSDEWKAMTVDSHQVDVRRIELENDKNRFGALCEAFKYALKLNDLEPADQVHAAEVLQGRRLQRAFGNLHGVEINEALIDTIEREMALQPYVDLVYHYNSSGYVLVETADYGPLGLYKTKKKNRKRLEEKPITSKGFTQECVDKWIQGKCVDNPGPAGS